MGCTEKQTGESVWEKWKSKEDNFAKCKSIRSILIYGTVSAQVPAVSVIIPAYRKPDGLKDALDSAIGQDYGQPTEIIVIDDSGIDTEINKLMDEYCQKHPNILYYRNEENLGVFGNLNRTSELCRSEWYCLLHDDDKMKPGYLRTCMSAVSSLSDDVGLIGSYMETVDVNTEKARKTAIDKFVGLFIRLRREKPIYLSLKDNVKHIFVLPCCLFINRDKVIELGGHNEDHYPSGDLVLAAKMNCYYQTVFLPVILSERGVGNNVSLKQSVCEGSIKAAYRLTIELVKEMGDSQKKQKRKASIAAVIAEIGVSGNRNAEYSELKSSLGMKTIYNKKLVITLINIYSKLSWALLLFRRSGKRRAVV